MDKKRVELSLEELEKTAGGWEVDQLNAYERQRYNEHMEALKKAAKAFIDGTGSEANYDAVRAEYEKFSIMMSRKYDS